MKVRWALLIIPLVGCAAPPPEAAPPQQTPQPVKIIVETSSINGGKLGIRGLHDELLTVGASLERAQELFPNPKPKTALTDLPPGFDPGLFQRWGWSDDKTGDGFGVVLDRPTKKIILALVIAAQLRQTDLDAAVGAYSDTFGEPKKVGDDLVAFWFWEDGKHRLMLSATANASGGFTLTSAVGVASAMDAIKADEKDAERFFARAKQILDQRPTKPK